ncbi:MAG: hypothetical protein IT285_03990 [Bdellovibrionales bacterium]|nr:hypothetical protein [Bdellovibrionales bacterium]
MQHRFDWRVYQEFLTVGARGVPLAENAGPALFVAREGAVISGYSSGEDTDEWLGTSTEELRLRYAHREHRVVEEADLQKWIREALAKDHVVDQAECLRRRLGADPGGTQLSRPVAYHHFLLDGLQGWWSRVLPSNYGIYLRLERPRGVEGAPRELCLVVRGGRLESFHSPDLSGMARTDTRGDEDLVRYLSEKYLVPFQGAVIPERDWEDWSKLAEPWRLVLMALRARRARLVPFRWGLAGLLGARAYFGL